jgi:NMD protein affecting ribosome stability and mRNA decay
MAGPHHKAPRPRTDQIYEPHVTDPYQTRKKWHEPTCCPNCGAVFHKGRWQWLQAQKNAEQHLCPACARIRDGIAAGFLQLEGSFLMQHRDEILRLSYNLEEKEKQAHPLERIIGIEENDTALIISFTGVHLTRATGEAIHHAYQGELSIKHNERDDQMRVHWSR